jgi:hypothetical protein
MTVTNIEGKIILLASTRLLADEVAATIVIRRSSTAPTS